MSQSNSVPDQNDHPRPLPSALYDEDYFLTACEGYQQFLDHESEQLSRRLEQAFQVSDVSAGMRILDVGSGRGEIVRHCGRLGAHSFGIDYAAAANKLAQCLLGQESASAGTMSIGQADAKALPFADESFDRVLMFDIVEHLHPWELHKALLDARRVLRENGRLIVHTAPNRWYDRYAYPLVRLFRTIQGSGVNYPKSPRAIIPANLHVHVNEQDVLSLRRALGRAGFRARVWLDTPPQRRQEGSMMAFLRDIAFGVPPFRWFFEREVFAVAWKTNIIAPED